MLQINELSIKIIIQLTVEMMKLIGKITGLLILCGFLSLNAYSQRLPAWNKYPYELVFGAGTTTFLGDLGGGSGVGKNHIVSVADIDWALIKPSAHVGMRLRFAERFAVKAGLYYGILEGSDLESASESRYYRNLSFQSNVFELSTQLEFFFLTASGKSNYVLSGSGVLGNMDMYLFGGVGGFHFNPKAQTADGTWHELQPLGTEGQGLDGMPARYSLYSVAFPIGLGIRYHLNQRWTIGLEMGGRYTLTDYIDDASDSYYDNDLIRQNYGDAAAELADRRIDESGNPVAPAPSGTPWRGNPENTDTYNFAMLNFTYRYQVYSTSFSMFKTNSPYGRNRARRQQVLDKQQALQNLQASNRLDLVFGVGSMHYLGDLGGGEKEGSHFFSVRDIDLALTRPSLSLGLRYRIRPKLNVNGTFAYGLIFGDDAQAGANARKKRQLNFKSNVFEFTARLEYLVKTWNQGRRNLNYTALYVFGGAGGFYFNPKTQAADNGWYDLQPLGTEGQGLNGNPDFYSLYQFAFPLGVGYKYSIDDNWSIGAEYCVRYTTTDYLDDVSGDYYDIEAIRAAYGDIAAELSDRRETPTGVGQRGSPEYNDSYMSFNITLGYSFSAR